MENSVENTSNGKFKFNLTLKQILKILFYNLLFVTVLFFVYQNLNWQELDIADIRVNWLFLLISGVFFTLFYLLFALGWQSVVSLYTDTSNKPVFLTYLSAQMFKYLPTSIFIFSFQAIFTKNMGISLKKVSIAILMQYAFVLTTALIVFLLFSEWMLLGLGLLTALLVGLVLTSLDIIKLNNIPLLGHLFKFEDHSLKLFIRILLFHIFAWMAGGISLFFFSEGLGYSNSIANIISFQSISSAISILAVFAPGGIGVREYVLSLSSLTVNAIILWRIFTAIYDIILSLTALYLQRKFKVSS